MQQPSMVYVAAPFWNEDENVRKRRRQKAIEYSERLFRKGIKFYSPLLYSERFKEKKARENYWIEHGLKMVDVCDEMRVLCLEGWKESSGLSGEIERAREKGIPVHYIENHARVSFHGSRTIRLRDAESVILAEFEKHLPETVVTHGEPGGVCEHVRKLAKEHGYPLKTYHLQHWRMQGQFHHRSLAVLEDSEYAVFIHDGESRGTSNELSLAQKLKTPYTYYKLVDGKLVDMSDNEPAGGESPLEMVEFEPIQI